MSNLCVYRFQHGHIIYYYGNIVTCLRCFKNLRVGWMVGCHKTCIVPSQAVFTSCMHVIQPAIIFYSESSDGNLLTLRLPWWSYRPIGQSWNKFACCGANLTCLYVHRASKLAIEHSLKHSIGAWLVDERHPIAHQTNIDARSFM